MSETVKVADVRKERKTWEKIEKEGLAKAREEGKGWCCTCAKNDFRNNEFKGVDAYMLNQAAGKNLLRNKKQEVVGVELNFKCTNGLHFMSTTYDERIGDTLPTSFKSNPAKK